MAIWWSCITTYLLAILATSYCLNRNNRVSSFHWTRGSKLCFLTRFSYLSCYFLILVISWNRYSLITSRLSWLHGNLISRPVSCTFGTTSWYVVHAPPYFWHRTRWFLEARRFPSFAEGFWSKRLLGKCKSYLSYSQKPSNWHFLAWPKPRWTMQYSSGNESSRDFQTCE